MDNDAAMLLSVQEQMESDRSTLETHCREIAERLGLFQMFRGEDVQQGQKRTEKQFDSTAALALDRFGAAMESILTPRSSRWHRLIVSNEKARKSQAIKRWCEEATDVLFALRYAPRANFASQMHETYTGLGAFGTSGVFVDDDLGRGLRYASIHLSELFIANDFVGRIDTVHRKFEMTARQAMQWFHAKPRTGEMPQKIRDAFEKNPSQKFWFVHCVRPNEEWLPSRRDYRGMKIASYMVSLEGKTVLDRRGYRTMPYAVSRYKTSPREVYGRSPSMTVLADIKMLNEMEKTNLRAAHRRIAPPLLAVQDGALSGFSTGPDAINYGTLDRSGNPLVRPMDVSGDPGFALELTDQKRRLVNDAFLVTLFQILVENKTMTATEAMYRAQEKGALLAPTGGRQQSELLGPIIEREIDIASAAGLLPPMPRELLDLGGEVDIEYTSPLALAQKADEGVGILRTLEAMTPLAQIDPGVMRRVNPDKVVQKLWELNGAPLDCLYTDDELDEIKAADADQAKAQQLLDAAPVAANAAKTMAEALATRERAGPTAGVQ